MPSLLPRAAVLALVIGCSVYNTPEVTELPRPHASDSIVVSSPVKAHLLNGSTVVYRRGMVTRPGESLGGKSDRRQALRDEPNRSCRHTTPGHRGRCHDSHRAASPSGTPLPRGRP